MARQAPKIDSLPEVRAHKRRIIFPFLFRVKMGFVLPGYRDMFNAPNTPSVVLASSSPYRRRQMQQLGMPFSAVAPNIDESPHAGETAADLVRRLARDKAMCVAKAHTGTWVVGSDQAAELDGEIMGKPGDEKVNAEQLTKAAGREVSFFTGLCLCCPAQSLELLDVVRYAVRFRALSTAQIDAYVKREQAFDCAGGFKSEGLGIALFESMHGDDPNALIGLPLIRLTEMLSIAGYDVLSQTRIEHRL